MHIAKLVSLAQEGFFVAAYRRRRGTFTACWYRRHLSFLERRTEHRYRCGSFPRAGIGVTSPTTLQKRIGTATLPSRAGIGVPPATAGLSNAIPLAGSAYAGVYPFSTAATDLSYDFAADSPDNPFGPFNSPSTASSGVYPFHCTAAAFGFDDDNPHDYTTAFYYRRISSASGG